MIIYVTLELKYLRCKGSALTYSSTDKKHRSKPEKSSNEALRTRSATFHIFYQRFVIKEYFNSLQKKSNHAHEIINTPLHRRKQSPETFHAKNYLMFYDHIDTAGWIKPKPKYRLWVIWQISNECSLVVWCYFEYTATLYWFLRVYVSSIVWGSSLKV